MVAAMVFCLVDSTAAYLVDSMVVVMAVRSVVLMGALLVEKVTVMVGCLVVSTGFQLDCLLVLGMVAR